MAPAEMSNAKVLRSARQPIAATMKAPLPTPAQNRYQIMKGLNTTDNLSVD
jgi:hypothetical protein